MVEPVSYNGQAYIKHMCETPNHLVLVLNDNKLMFVSDNELEVINVIRLDEQICSADVIDNGRLLVLTSDGGNIKLLELDKITQGLEVNSLDFKAPEL